VGVESVDVEGSGVEGSGVEGGTVNRGVFFSPEKQLGGVSE
jgi:hypothetical protein